jgi:hypothetical protein
VTPLISSLSILWKAVRVLAAILAGALYADKLGIVDVRGWVADTFGHAEPGGGGV